MKMTLRPTTGSEYLYCYTQSTQICGQTGNIGFLVADMDTDGVGFFPNWEDKRSYLKTDEFIQDFQYVMNILRSGETDGQSKGIIADRETMARYCFAFPDAKIPGSDNSFGFRIDTENYSYMLRLTPNRGENNVYCYAYKKDWFNGHMQNAEQGIRFVTSRYEDLFTIPDGGKIEITYPDGYRKTDTCRFIDAYHLEIGRNLYHICEFAEIMERNNCKIKPVTAHIANRNKNNKNKTETEISR